MPFAPVPPFFPVPPESVDSGSEIPVRGLDLRYALLVALDCEPGLDWSVAELVEQLAALGVRPPSGKPRKDVADALRWEVRRARVIRTGWGRYQLGRLPRTTRWRAYDRVRTIVELGSLRFGGVGGVDGAGGLDGWDLGGRAWTELM